jgi:hypothetical protein
MPGHDNSPACEACWDRLEQDLAELPALLDELEVVLARQDRVQKPPARRRRAPLDDEDEQLLDRDIPPWLRAEHQPRIKPRPLPLRLEAVDVLTDLHTQLLRAVGAVLRDNPACRRRAVEGPPRRGERRPVTYVPLPAPRPLSDSRAAARFLLSALAWMRARPDQHTAIRSVHKAVRSARALIDTADALVYCGICSTTRPAAGGGCPGPDVCPCGCHDGHGNPCTIPGGCGLGQPAGEPVICQEELYAVDHRHLTKRRIVDGRLEVDQHVCMDCSFIRCRTCGTRHDVAERRRLLLDAARDYLVTTTEACRAIATYADGNLKEATVWKWKERGRVVARGHTVENGTRQDLYRLGDLMDLAAGTRRDTREGA